MSTSVSSNCPDDFIVEHSRVCFRSALEDGGVCVAADLSFSEESSGPEEYRVVIDKLLETKGAVGVVVLADTRGASTLFQARVLYV